MGGRKERKEEKKEAGKAGQDQDRHYQLDEGVSCKFGVAAVYLFILSLLLLYYSTLGTSKVC